MDDGRGGLLRPRRRMLNDRTRAAETLAPQRVLPQTPVLTPAERSARGLRRTADMVEALRQLDLAPSPQAQREIVEWLRSVHEARGGGILLGLFGHCYLGHPYVDHAFDMSGQIMQHYTAADHVPPLYTTARPFAVSEAYAYIEIYSDGQVVPVRPDGSPVL